MTGVRGAEGLPVLMASSAFHRVVDRAYERLPRTVFRPIVLTVFARLTVVKTVSPRTLLSGSAGTGGTGSSSFESFCSPSKLAALRGIRELLCVPDEEGRGDEGPRLVVAVWGLGVIGGAVGEERPRGHSVSIQLNAKRCA